MCRLAHITRPFCGMREWLRQMESSNGGHGCGVAFGKKCVKGRHETAATTAAIVEAAHLGNKRARRKRPPALWHTRLTSSGGHHDSLCHPFECDGGWLVNNGHWHAMHQEATKWERMSDTRLFSLLVDRDGFAAAVARYEPPGVWLHMRYDGAVAISKSSGRPLVYSPEFLAYGSEPAERGDWYTVQDGYADYGEEAALGERCERRRKITRLEELLTIEEYEL